MVDDKLLKPIDVGGFVLVDVLEALPGRRIEGIRKVRPDGTISLGFYGDIYVKGLNRNQVKVKVVEQLRHYLNDEALGLAEIVDNPDGKELWKRIDPLHTSRVFVDDDPLSDQIDKTDSKSRQLESKLNVLSAQVADLESKLDELSKALKAAEAK